MIYIIQFLKLYIVHVAKYTFQCGLYYSVPKTIYLSRWCESWHSGSEAGWPGFNSRCTPVGATLFAFACAHRKILIFLALRCDSDYRGRLFLCAEFCEHSLSCEHFWCPWAVLERRLPTNRHDDAPGAGGQHTESPPCPFAPKCELEHG